MSKKISGFRSQDQQDKYLQIYDRLVETHWPVPCEEIDLESRFGTTRVRVSGEGAGLPLVLLHPTMGSSVGWYPLIAQLCAERKVYTPDTIGGAGRSIQTEPMATGDDLVAWLEEVLDGLGLDHLHLAGYSEGGWIAGLYAALAQHRDRLASLILIEPAGAIEPVPSRFIAAMIWRGMRVVVSRDKRAAVERLNRWMNGEVELTDAQFELLDAAMGSFRQRLPRPERLGDDQLRGVAAAPLLILGADTKLYDPHRARARALTLIRNARVEIIANAGHGVAFQHPDLVTALILDHISPPK